MFLRAKLPPVKKVGLFVLFSGGVFVAMTGVFRCILIASVSKTDGMSHFIRWLTNTQDPDNSARLAGAWVSREAFVAVITANLPMSGPLFQKLTCSPYKTMFRSTTKNCGRSGPEARDFILLERSWRGRGRRGTNPMANATFGESEERICSGE